MASYDVASNICDALSREASLAALGAKIDSAQEAGEDATDELAELARAVSDVAAAASAATADAAKVRVDHDDLRRWGEGNSACPVLYPVSL
jgi:hypothetical protein